MRKPRTQWLPLCLLLITCSPAPPESEIDTGLDTRLDTGVESIVESSEEEPIPTIEEEPEPLEIDWILVADLERAADDLERLAEDARIEVMAMGEVEGEATPGLAQLESDWMQWSRDWNERLRLETPTLPNIPFDTPTPELIYAKQAVERGWHELRLLPMTAYSWTNVPALYERERHLNAAKDAAEEARQQLRNLER